jgi:hypothetical protein
MKKACWRGKSAGYNTTRYSLFDIATKKELEFGGFSSWNNPVADLASLDLEIAIEERAEAAGYEIVENPWD